ncbi:MAG TPA: hypothetical protein VIV14_09820 [Gammaproteobacteria bacterium]
MDIMDLLKDAPGLLGSRSERVAPHAADFLPAAGGLAGKLFK